MKSIPQIMHIKKYPMAIKDSKGNTIYYEDSVGFWYKKRFNKNRVRTYYENSAGDKFQCKVDKNGFETYY